MLTRSFEHRDREAMVSMSIPRHRYQGHLTRETTAVASWNAVAEKLRVIHVWTHVAHLTTYCPRKPKGLLVVRDRE